VLLGAALGFGLVFAFRNAPLPAGTPVAAARQAALPPAFWAYWFVVTFSCAFEFSVLLWSPAFLERVIGLSAAEAATAASGFFIGSLSGRIALRALVQRLPARSILIAAFITGFVGFALYWGVDRPWAAIIGVFMLGLCVAPQYPLTMSLALGVAKGAHDAASARMTLAFGLAVLLAPALLGALADIVGLRYAHLTLPTLTAAGLTAFLIAGALTRRLNWPA
jgi:fucose permease